MTNSLSRTVAVILLVVIAGCKNNAQLPEAKSQYAVLNFIDRVWDATDFGAYPNDGVDDGKILQHLIDSGNTLTGTTIITLKPGVWCASIMNPPDTKVKFIIPYNTMIGRCNIDTAALRIGFHTDTLPGGRFRHTVPSPKIVRVQPGGWTMGVIDYNSKDYNRPSGSRLAILDSNTQYVFRISKDSVYIYDKWVVSLDSFMHMIKSVDEFQYWPGAKKKKRKQKTKDIRYGGGTDGDPFQFYTDTVKSRPVLSIMDNETNHQFRALQTICEPVASPDSLIKWHMERILHWMKVKQGKVTRMPSGNEPDLMWDHNGKLYDPYLLRRKPIKQ